MGIGELLQKIFDMLMRFWPLAVVQPWQRGVRVRWGKHMRLFGPGVHLVLPFVDEMNTADINAELFRTQMQTVDGVSFQFVGGFRLVDLQRFYTALNDDPIVSVCMAVAAAGGEAMTEASWKGGGATDAMLKVVKRRAGAKCRSWGIRLEWIDFATVTDSPSLRLLS